MGSIEQELAVNMLRNWILSALAVGAIGFLGWEYISSAHVQRIVAELDLAGCVERAPRGDVRDWLAKDGAEKWLARIDRRETGLPPDALKSHCGETIGCSYVDVDSATKRITSFIITRRVPVESERSARLVFRQVSRTFDRKYRSVPEFSISHYRNGVLNAGIWAREVGQTSESIILLLVEEADGWLIECSCQTVDQ